MSTINYTYNVIVDRFRQFAAGHFQLRRFTHGEISQADLEKEAEWPWLHIKPRAINYAPGTRTFSFEIFISDLPRDKEDKTGYQAESITDCSLIFQDLINEIYLGNMFGSDVVLTRPVNAEPFVEQYTHTLTGVTGTIELNLDYDWSACSIPASWNYNTPTDSGADGWGALQFIESLDQNGVFVSLLNDVEAPGNSYYYGTNAEGIKGWYAIVDNVGLTCETLPDCATIISILDDIATLQTDVALKANTTDLGATAFSNDYNDLDNLPTIPSIAGLATVTYVDQQDNLKVDKIAGKGLSTEDYTTAEKSKLAGIQAGAEVNVNADWNAVSGDAQILNKPTIPSIAGLATVTYVDAQDATKQNTLVSGTNIKTIEGQSLLGAGNIDLTKSDVGLSNVDNTSDINKPISTATQTALNAKQDSLGFTPVPTTRSITINGTTQDLSADRTFTIASNPGTVTSVAALTLGTTGTDLSSTVANSTSTPVITLNVPTASATNRGVLSSADWSTFNGKQGALTLTTIGTSGAATLIGNTLNIPQYAGTNIYNADGSLTAARTLTLNTFALTITGTSSSRFFANGNVGIGTTTDAGYKLDVNGTARVQGNAQFGNGFYWDNTNGRLGIGTASPAYGVDIAGAVGAASSIRTGWGVYSRYLFNPTATATWIEFQPSTHQMQFTINGTEAIRIPSTRNVLIGTTTDVASSKLTVESTTQGFLPPRMTTTQKNAIASPIAGLVVYDTTLNKLCVRGASAWETITSI